MITNAKPVLNISQLFSTVSVLDNISNATFVAF